MSRQTVAMPSRLLCAAAVLLWVVVLLAMDAAGFAAPNPFAAPAPLAWGSGEAPTGAHCTGL